MASWREIESDAPEFAARVRARFDAGTNKVLATLRKDGSPRVSGTEAKFDDGELMFGSMPGARKLLDIRRDPRVAMHSPTLEPPSESPQAWEGDAKLAGRAVEVPPPADTQMPDSGFFRLDISEAVLTRVGDPPDHLVIESWHEGSGYHRRERR
ncbi:pyridoxamine 5'-phosphate oxidase family protein [Actinoplanes sp. NPDC051633]|uniref:pyridoxamine 5'-phosphate oxidase family protein n=1 Tax=Actinoplanes sp. NPDC051633 TaxID=3155670 RepID=UPI003419CE78